MVAPISRSRSATEPPRVSSTPGGGQAVVGAGRLADEVQAGIEVRVAVTGRRVIVTVTVVGIDRDDARRAGPERRVLDRPRSRR